MHVCSETIPSLVSRGRKLVVNRLLAFDIYEKLKAGVDQTTVFDCQLQQGSGVGSR